MTSVLPAHAADDAEHFLALARNVLLLEADAVRALSERLGPAFLAAHAMMLGTRGRVVVTGMGKSGHIGGKIASTLASTGTPAFFMHPGEAIHGDLGMITRDDVVLAISNSGESEEVLKIIPPLKRRGTAIIAMTAKPQSSLAQASDVHLDIGVEREACPLGLAPTTSTTATLAMGDALALALLDARGFTSEDFAAHHPGGALGRRLLLHVRDVMRIGAAIPRVTPGTFLPDAIVEMSRKGMGMVAIATADDQLTGIFTDFDLRRSIERHDSIRTVAVDGEMNRNPRTVTADKLAVEAVEIMQRERPVSVLLVVDGTRLAGAVNVHDLMQAGVL
jgi:arabinose-5-phosphate isomerase